MSETESRFTEGLGERYMKTGAIRCQAVSKTRLKQLRIKYNDPLLRSSDVWPEGQCSWSAEPDTFACSLHGGKSPNTIKRNMSDWMPVDLRLKLESLESNNDAIFNRDREIGQLLARNAQLYESLEDLVLGIEGYQAVAESLKQIRSGDVVAASQLLEIALNDSRTDREVMDEIRKNMELINKMTVSQFSIRKELKIMTTVDQLRSLLEGMYRGFEKIARDYIPEETQRSRAIQQFAALMREVANARHTSEITVVN